MANLQVSNEFVLPHSSEQLPAINDGLPLLSNIREIVPQRPVTNGTFGSGGVIPFPFTVGPQERGMLNQGYFRMRAQIQGSVPAAGTDGGITAYQWSAPVKSFSNVASFDQTAGTPVVSWHSYEGHDIALAENAMANMFSTVRFKMGGTTISEITQYVPQIDTLIRRLTESYSSQQATKYCDMFGMSLRERIDYLAGNATAMNGKYGNITGHISAFAATTQVTAGTGALFGTDGPCYAPTTSPFGMIKFSDGTTPAGLGPGGTTTSSVNVEMLWRPRCIGIFNTDQFLVGGQYLLEMLPDTNWYVNMFESCINIPPQNIYSTSIPAVPSGPNQFAVSIQSFNFYLPVCASPEYISNQKFYMSLEEYRINGLPVGVTSGQVSFTQTLPWSTQTIATVLQTSAIGQQTVCPPNKFYNIWNGGANDLIMPDINTNNMESIQIVYSKTYPETNFVSQMSYFNGVQNNYQRYYETFSNSRSLWDYGQQEPYATAQNIITAITPYNSAAGAANSGISQLPNVVGLSQADYLSRGQIIAVSVAKPQDNKTTQCTIYLNMKNDLSGLGGYTGLAPSGNALILILSCFKKTAEVVVSNGVIISVNCIEG